MILSKRRIERKTLSTGVQVTILDDNKVVAQTIVKDDDDGYRWLAAWVRRHNEPLGESWLGTWERESKMRKMLL